MVSHCPFAQGANAPRSPHGNSCISALTALVIRYRLGSAPRLQGIRPRPQRLLQASYRGPMGTSPASFASCGHRPAPARLPAYPRGHPAAQQRALRTQSRNAQGRLTRLPSAGTAARDTGARGAPCPRPTCLRSSVGLPGRQRTFGAAGLWEIEAKKGLPSADRNNKATLLLTGPFRTAKSSAKDLIPRVMKLRYAEDHRALPAQWQNRLLRYEAEAYSDPSATCGRCRRVLAWILT